MLARVLCSAPALREAMTVRGGVVAAALLVLDSSPSGCIKLAVMQVQ